MIVTTSKEINGVEYKYTYSDPRTMIECDGERYIEAIDPTGSNRKYVETNEAIVDTNAADLKSRTT